MSGIVTDLHSLKRCRDEQQECFNGINSLHSTIKKRMEEKVPEPITEEDVMSLRSKYQEAFTGAANEIANIHSLLGKVKRQIEVTHQKETKKKKKQSDLPPIPKHVKIRNGDIWSHDQYVIAEGQIVAADIDKDTEFWILTSVVSFISNRGERYRVQDEDSANRKVYTVNADRIVPLYSLEDYPLSKRARFKKGDAVVAMFPSTTAFYACTVINPPKKGERSYEVQFYDDDAPSRNVDAQFVFPVPEHFQ